MPSLPFNALLLPVVLCFAFLLVLVINYKTASYKSTCLLELLIAVRTVTVNANGIPETPGPPASTRGAPVQL
jgi:hypothetical protein